MIDLHCHILPGVDDGPEELDESLRMARAAAADGIRTIVATPHLPPDEFACPDRLFASLPALQELCAAEGLPLTFLPGAEIPPEPDLLEYLGTLPRLGEQSRYLLLEMPLLGLPTYLEELIFALQVKGITPVLAHPERSRLAQQRPETILRLAERGCPLQLNAGSLLGRYGRTVRLIARRLLGQVPGCVLATDAHGADTRTPRLTAALRAMNHLGGERRFREVAFTNPAKILAGERLS